MIQFSLGLYQTDSYLFFFHSSLKELAHRSNLFMNQMTPVTLNVFDSLKKKLVHKSNLFVNEYAGHEVCLWFTENNCLIILTSSLIWLHWSQCMLLLHIAHQDNSIARRFLPLLHGKFVTSFYCMTFNRQNSHSQVK